MQVEDIVEEGIFGTASMETTQPMEIDRENTEISETVYGPETKDEWKNRLMGNLKKQFDAINSTGENSVIFKEYIKKERVIVDVDIIFGFF